MRVSKAYNTIQAQIALSFRMPPGSAIAAGIVHVALFSGTPPTDDQLQTLLATTNTMTSWSASLISAFATQSNFLGNVTLGAFTPTMDYDNNVFNLPLSAQPNLFTIATSGTPTWFMLRQCSAAITTDAWANFVQGTNLYNCLVGTVGDENSAADLKIVGGTVTAGQPVRVPDMRIKF